MVKVLVIYLPTFDTDTFEFTDNFQGIHFIKLLLERDDICNIDITII